MFVLKGSRLLSRWDDRPRAVTGWTWSKMSAAQIYPVTSYYHLHGNMQSGTTNWAFEEVQCPHFSFVYECDAEKKRKIPWWQFVFSSAECLCASKWKGLWNVVWRAAGPLGVKCNFERRGHFRATLGLLHLKTRRISAVRAWNLGCLCSLATLLSLSS